MGDTSGERLTAVLDIASRIDPGRSLGRIHLGVRMLRPIKEALQLHQQRAGMLKLVDPAHKSRYLRQRYDARALGAARNTLVFRIEAVEDVVAQSGETDFQACAYYQFYDVPTCDTGAIQLSDGCGAFDDEQHFPVLVTPALHQYLNETQVEVVVFDAGAPFESSLCGVAVVDLSALARCARVFVRVLCVVRVLYVCCECGVRVVCVWCACNGGSERIPNGSLLEFLFVIPPPPFFPPATPCLFLCSNGRLSGVYGLKGGLDDDDDDNGRIALTCEWLNTYGTSHDCVAWCLVGL